MVRRQCICGAQLHGLGHSGPNMFGFIPSSSLAHCNYDCEFNVGVTLPGGRIFEQCETCGALVLCEYPTMTGSKRGDDPLITYGPGTVYEQCPIESVPLTYRSFHALMSSGVTGGIMYSEPFKSDVAELFGTDTQHLPSWKVVKDALRDQQNAALDEWWQASIGRNFIVLYENSKVLRLVGAWHRVPGTEILNADMRRVIEDNHDPLRHQGSDTDEVKQARQHLDISDDTRALLMEGTRARLRLVDNSMMVHRPLAELARFTRLDELLAGKELWEAGAVKRVDFVPFGIFHGIVHDGARDQQVDLVIRHNLVSRMMCTCDYAQRKRVCSHEVATIVQLARQFRFSIDLDAETADVSHREVTSIEDSQFSHYANMLDVLREHDNDDDYDWLTVFIDPLSGDPRELYHTEFMTMPGMTMRSMSYVIYEPLMLSFIDAVLTHGSPDFLKTLRSYGLDADVPLEILNIDMLKADLVSALISMIVYRERRSDGYLAECLENGTLLKLLNRLRTLQDERHERRRRRIRQ